MAAPAVGHPYSVSLERNIGCALAMCTLCKDRMWCRTRSSSRASRSRCDQSSGWSRAGLPGASAMTAWFHSWRGSCARFCFALWGGACILLLVLSKQLDTKTDNSPPRAPDVGAMRPCSFDTKRREKPNTSHLGRRGGIWPLWCASCLIHTQAWEACCGNHSHGLPIDSGLLLLWVCLMLKRWPAMAMANV